MDQYLPWNGLSSGGGGGESADRPLPPASLTPSSDEFVSSRRGVGRGWGSLEFARIVSRGPL